MATTIKISQTNLTWNMFPGVKRSTQTIEVINQSADSYLFKIKSTSRSRFLVQPSSGLIKPYQKTKIKILVDLSQSSETALPINDKFSLYTLIAPLNSESKDSLDFYIKSNSKDCQSTVIPSTINFLKNNENNMTDFGLNEKSNDFQPETGKSIPIKLSTDKIFESTLSETKNLPKDDYHQIRNLGETSEQIFMSNMQSETAGLVEERSRLVIRKQDETSHIREELKQESDFVLSLKKRILSLEAELKLTTVG